MNLAAGPGNSKPRLGYELDSGADPIRLSEVVSALSHALDITEGQPEGHAIRSGLIGMRLAREIRLPVEERSALFYALLLKDLGCSSNAAKVCSLFAADDRSIKRGLKTIDWTRWLESFNFVRANMAPDRSPLKRALQTVSLGLQGQSASKELFRTRCERGGEIARLLGFSEATAQAILALDEHWDGQGEPLGLKRDEIPLLARILGLAQTVEVYYTSFGSPAALEMAVERSGKWFDPELVLALIATGRDHTFWGETLQGHLEPAISSLEPTERLLQASPERIDKVAEGFARVIDAKSPWTFLHSEGVAEIAVGIGEILGYSLDELREVRRAALLHDIGKLGVSNLILDKAGALTDPERAAMRRHTEYTQVILERVVCFRKLADFSSAHHERLDGKGYHRGLTGDRLPQAARILAVADIYEAMSAERPYRPCQPQERILTVMARDAGSAICPECFEGLKLLLERKAWKPARIPKREEAVA